MKLLYIGKPDSQREKEFVGFLREHFREVGTGDLTQFAPARAEGFDVVLLDWEGDGFKAPRPNLPKDYTRPTLTIGVAGAFICDSLELKTGYT